MTTMAAIGAFGSAFPSAGIPWVIGGAGNGGGFSPPDLTGLVGWGKARGRIIIGGGGVSEFHELTYIAAVQGSSPKQPALEMVGGKLAVHYDGIDDTHSGVFGSDIDSPMTLVLLVYFDLLDQANQIALSVGGLGQTGADTMASIGRNETERYYTFDGASALASVNAVPGQQWHRIIATHDTSSTFHRAWANGIEGTVTDNAAGLTTDGELFLSGFRTLGGTLLDGAIAEYALYNELKSDSEIEDQLDPYLAAV